VIYVYAIADGAPSGHAALAGFGDAPLRAVEHGSLVALYSPDPPRDLTPTEDALWRHERIVEALMAERAVLPLRFGSTLASELELRELLIARAKEFAAALATVRGRVELGVRASVRAAEAGAPVAESAVSGRAYLEAKLARRRAAARLGESLHAELVAAARASTFRLHADPRPEFAGAYLVDREQVEDFRRRVEAARDARPEVELACSGPWPPFSFTGPAAAQ
jgi:hypothetical protein